MSNNRGGGLLNQFPPFRYFPIFFSIVKTNVYVDNETS